MLSYDANNQIKVTLIDFGCAIRYKPGYFMDQCMGSIFYIAPEVWLECYIGSSCDIWSFGIVLYSLITKRFPFDSKSSNTEGIKRKTLKKKVKFLKSDTHNKALKKLIKKKLLAKNYQKRI